MHGSLLFDYAADLARRAEFHSLTDIAAKEKCSLSKVTQLVQLHRQICDSVKGLLREYEVPMQQLFAIAALWDKETEKPFSRRQHRMLEKYLLKVGPTGRKRRSPRRKTLSMPERARYLRGTPRLVTEGALDIVLEVLDYLEGVERRFYYLKVKR